MRDEKFAEAADIIEAVLESRRPEALAEAVLAGRQPDQSSEDYHSLCLDAVVDLARAVKAYPHRVDCSDEVGCVDGCIAAERDFEHMKRMDAERERDALARDLGVEGLP